MTDGTGALQGPIRYQLGLIPPGPAQGSAPEPSLPHEESANSSIVMYLKFYTIWPIYIMVSSAL